MNTRGFTLIELLVALAIFAIIAVMGYRGISAMLDAEPQINAAARRWQQLDRFLTEIESDYLYAVPRSSRDPGGLMRFPLYGDSTPVGADDGNLTLTRYVPADESTDIGMQRIAYRFEPKKIVLLVWPALDAAPRTRPARIEVLDGVTSAKMRYLDAANRWNDMWPPADKAAQMGDAFEMPRAIELTLNIEKIGQVTRLYAR